MANVEGIDALLAPESVAVIGASEVKNKIGNVIVRNLKEYGYKGKIYPINKKADEIKEIEGLKVYASILDVPGPVDLAVISIPAQFVAESLEECGKKGVKAIDVISSGFGEVGNKEEEEELVRICKKYNMRLLGPNTFGVYYGGKTMNATFGPKDVIPGKVAFISQSGALGIALMGWTILQQIGMSAIISTGNKAEIDDADLLEWLASDPSTNAILMYVEGIKDGQKFMETARKVVLKKPIVVIKSGRSKRGAQAAASHTGSLAGADNVFDAAMKQVGVLRAADFGEAFDWVKALSQSPPLKAKESVIVTNGGGVGVLATDACEFNNIPLIVPPDDMKKEFMKYMPSFGSPKNPVDLTGGANEKQYYDALKVAFKDDRIGTVIVLYCQTAVTDPVAIAKQIAQAYDEAGRNKPMVTSFVGGKECDDAMKWLTRNGIPSYPTPEQAVKALSAVYRWNDYKEKLSTRVAARARQHRAMS
ncbi:acetate--CoA ligase alpha subunit [Tardisphaera saccharovorans]